MYSLSAYPSSRGTQAFACKSFHKMSALLSVPYQFIIFCLTGSKWPVQWGDPRWPDGSQLFLSRWIFHMLLCVPQLWVSRWQMQDSAALVCSHWMWSFCDVLRPDITHYLLVFPGRIHLKFSSYVNWTAVIAGCVVFAYSVFLYGYKPVLPISFPQCTQGREKGVSKEITWNFLWWLFMPFLLPKQYKQS